MDATTELSQLSMFAFEHENDRGELEPRIEVRAPKGMPCERLQGALEALAAKVRRAMPDAARWLVFVEDLGEVTGRVYLDLDGGGADESAKAMAILRQIAA